MIGFLRYVAQAFPQNSVHLTNGISNYFGLLNVSFDREIGGNWWWELVVGIGGDAREKMNNAFFLAKQSISVSQAV